MKKIELKNDQKTLRLNEISIEDFRAHRILSSTADSDKEQKLSNAISIGFLCLERTASIAEVDWVSQRLQEHIMLLNYRLEEKSNEVIDLVKRNFDSERSSSLVAPFAITIEQARKDLSDKLKESIEVLREQERGLKEALSATFDSNNRTSQVHRFHEQLGLAMEGLEKRFDPSVEGSLLSTFLSRFSDLSAQAAAAPAVQQKIDALRDEVKEMVTHLTTKFSEQRAFDVEKADLINNTPAKGVVFEELVFNQLTEIASVRNDIVEDVGAQTGRGTSKKGDITYDSTESQVRLVYELKDQASTFTFQKIKDLMCESIENRNAHYGVFLVNVRCNEFPSGKYGQA